jgi:hypothetical protein
MVTMPEINSLQGSLSTRLQGVYSNQTIPGAILEPNSSGADFPVPQPESADSFQTAAPFMLFSLPESVVENPYWIGLTVLGHKGMQRLYSFAAEYQDGWGDGSGKALNPEAYKALFIFMRYAPINVSSRPSIFMSEDGGLELAWDDANNNDVRVEFGPSRVAYWFSGTGNEGSVEISETQTLAENFESL